MFRWRSGHEGGVRRDRRTLWTGGDAQGGGDGTVRGVTQPLRSAGLLVAGQRSGVGALGTKDMARAATRGDLRRLRRGAYVGADHWDSLDAVARHIVAVRAALVAQPDALVSHWSATAVHGLPAVGRRDEAVHLTVPPASGGRSTPRVRRHQSFRDAPTTVVDGIRVTSVARTLVDLAREAGLLAAVAAGDAALHTGIVTLPQLGAEIEACGTCRGVRCARRAVAFMDPLSESPGESLSRVRMAELGLPAPALQREIRDVDGLVARVDFLWPDLGVVGEFDGRAKYGLDDPRATADRVWKEKLREDRIRATGLVVARWTWSDAWRAAPMLRLLQAAGVR